MKLTDGKRLVDIKLKVWNGEQWGLDWSNEFYDNPEGYDRVLNVSIVKDVDYCIEQANDWKNSQGDFYTDENCVPAEDYMVDVTELLSENSAELTAFRIRHSKEWNSDDCEHLCELAGLEDSYKAANADTFESVVALAAAKLSVTIYEED